VLFVSHNMQAVRDLCTRAVYIKNGNLVQDNTVSNVLDNYLSENSNQEPYKVWKEGEEPHKSYLKILAIRSKNIDGETKYSYKISEDLIIEAEYEVVVENDTISISASLHDSDGNIIGGSLNVFEPIYHRKKYPKGRYKSSFIIPAHTLNTGKFFVTINFFGQSWDKEVISLNRVAFWEALEDNFLKGDYRGFLGGSIRPYWKWETVLQNE